MGYLGAVFDTSKSLTTLWTLSGKNAKMIHYLWCGEVQFLTILFLGKYPKDNLGKIQRCIYRLFTAAVFIKSKEKILYVSQQCCRKESGPERMVTSQVSGECLEWLPSKGSWLHTGKNSSANHSKVKEGLLRAKHPTEYGPPQKMRSTRVQGCRFLQGWVISQANEWEDYSNYFGEGMGISRNWATAHFSVFYGPVSELSCHLADLLRVYTES